MGYTARDAAEEIDALFRDLLPSAVNENVVALRKGRERVKSIAGERA
jgi:hypothetical protein